MSFRGRSKALSYAGVLSTPQEASPANMVVKYPLSKCLKPSSLNSGIHMSQDIGGQESLVVLDTDYTASSLVCTCQAVRLFVLRGHRISCSILQRDNTEDAAVTQRLTALLNTQLGENTFEFEFDKVNHVSEQEIKYFFLQFLHFQGWL